VELTGPRAKTGLVGRAQECALIEELLQEASSSRSRVLVISGEPGIGKTALLDEAVALASGYHVARATGVESEMEVPFAGLHQLCAPMLDRLSQLPDPQREAMSTAFGLAAGTVPDRFLIGLALLRLLSDESEHAPLLCVVDDAHWLDRASAHALAFVARRLLADPVCVLIGTRYMTEDFKRFPELVMEGIGTDPARALLAAVLPAPIDERVRDRIIAETHGNPLALLEWSRGVTAGELAGGFGQPKLMPIAGQIEESFRRRLSELPPATQKILTIAAAEPTGDAALLWRAAARLGAAGQDASPAIDAGLIEIDTTVRFRHPSVRSAAYAEAAIDDRRDAHRALADVTDPGADPERRAWHRALAAPGPDAEVAEELERSASRARGRGGLAAAAAFLERSAALTLDPERRAQRTIAAAAAHLEAGGPDAASTLLASVQTGPLDDFNRAQVEILRGNAATGWGHMGEGADLCLRAARRLEPIDVQLARDTHNMAYTAAALAGDLAQGTSVEDAARAARAAPAALVPGRPQDLLLDALASQQLDGPMRAAPLQRAALRAFAVAEFAPEEAWWWGLAQGVAATLWDYDAFYTLGARFLQAARELGALRMLTWNLDTFALAHVWAGDLTGAKSLIGELQSVIEATEMTSTSWAVVTLAAWRGHETEAEHAIGAVIEHAKARGQGGTIKLALSAEATLRNGLGHYEQALQAAEKASSWPPHTLPSTCVTWTAYAHMALRELVEAAARTGRPALASEALEQLSETAQASGTDWALGIEAGSRALLCSGDTAETLYQEAIDRLNRSPLRPEAARAHLVYGEWLRRENRRVDARRHLRAAHEALGAMGMDAFAGRASHELAATGETIRKRPVNLVFQLTPQELQIARLAADGLTNPEIGTQLFISAHTVQYHLRKVFTKLGLSSRRELLRVMPQVPGS
jgi:DNA-binding CsgD family transcriptional regulator/tetratricopeptide (TPR) repeat protein